MMALSGGRRLLALLFAIGLALLPVMAAAQASPSNWRATLTGGMEIPAVSTTATGTFTGVLDETAQTFTWTLAVPAITNATAAHIHAGTQGSLGPVVLNLFAPTSGPAGSIGVSGTARQADLLNIYSGRWGDFVAALKAGALYVNVHTTQNPNGEIRGQVLFTQATATPTATATATATVTASPTATTTAVPTGTATSVPTATATVPGATATPAGLAPSAPKTGSAGLTGELGRAGVAGLALLALVTVIGGRYMVSRRT